MPDSEASTRLKRAFPSSVATDVEEVLSALGPSVYPPAADDIGPVMLAGESLSIPARVYFREPVDDLVSRLSSEQRHLLSCIYSRHHNGYVREASLRRLIRVDAGWIAPYVVQLIGEYVIEILRVIEANMDVLEREIYQSFVAQNPAFLTLTRQRVISYWNEYHRRQTPRFEDYVGHRLLRALRSSVKGGGAAWNHTTTLRG